MDRFRLILVFVLVCVIPAKAVALECRSDTASYSLTDLFNLTGIPVQASYSKNDKSCSYEFEGNAFAPSQYKYCSNWQAQEMLEYIDEGILNSLIGLNNKKASIGSDKFGLENKFTYTQYDSAQQRLKARQRLTIKLLGGKLNLPPHNLAIDFFGPSATTPGGRSSVTWSTNNYSFNVNLPIPITPALTFSLGLAANYADNNSETDTSNRSQIYDLAKLYGGTAPTDWDKPNPFININDSSYWDDYNLVNSWELEVGSPWIGQDIGVASAKMKLALSASVEGKFHYAETFLLIKPNFKTQPCPHIASRLSAKTALSTQATGIGKMVVRVTIPFYSYTKEFEIISESISSGDVVFPDSTGSTLVDLVIPADITKCGLAPCSASLIQPVPPTFVSLTNPPSPDNSDPKADPVDFAGDVVNGIEETYFICDRDKRAINLKSKEFQGLIRMSQNVATRSKAGNSFAEYVKSNVFLCERKCVGVCLNKEKVGNLSKEKN